MATQRVFVVSLGLLVLVGLFAAVNQPVLWGQEEEEAPAVNTFAKDLQILEFESKAELGAYMRTMAESLGVTCKYCHDLTDFAVNDPDTHKEEARKFMRMVKSLNEGIFKDYEAKVTCYTCHMGREHPVNSAEEMARILEAEQGQ